MKKIDQCFSIDDLRLLAQKKIPRVAFDYIDGAAEDEFTKARNRNIYKTYNFVPRVLRDVSTIHLETEISGIKSALPILCAPTGLTRLFHTAGEKAVAQAAEKFDIPYVLSTVSNTSIEEIAACKKEKKFFQIYIWQNREWAYKFIDRVNQNGYDGVQMAVDLAAFGKRERDLHSGHGTNRLKRNMALGALNRWDWLYSFLTTARPSMANMVDYLPHGAQMDKVVDKVNEQFDASVTWDDALALRKYYGEKPFLLKGIQCVEDAIKAAELGFSGIVLSNHGGRQLEGAPSAIELLPRVRQAVGTNLEIIIDGGIMRGGDIIKAIALGANSCMIGRAYLYGLAAGGEAGVERALYLLKDEMERVMKLIGCNDIKKLDSSYVEKIEII